MTDEATPVAGSDMRLALNQLDGMVMITTATPLDGHGPKIVYVNDAFVRDTGYAWEEVIGRTPRILQGPGTDRRILDRVRAALRAHQPVTAELINYRKSGEPFRMECRISPVFDRAGRCTHFTAIERDVTAQRSEAQRESLATVALDAVAEGIAVLDGMGTVILVNQAFSAITGYAAEAVLGKKLQLGPQHSWSLTFDKVRSLVAEHGTWEGELWTARRDGSTYPALVRINRYGTGHDSGGHYLVAFRNLAHRKEMEARMRQRALYDPLTSLPTRLLIEDRTNRAIERARRHGGHVALLFLDLDQLKQINDSLGHNTGDELLKSVADLLRVQQRESDTIARMGGDEFILLADEIGDPREAGIIAGRVLEAFRRPIDLRGGTIYTSVSIGIACFPGDGGDFSALLHHAERGMYRAKQQGRNQYRFYAPHTDVNAVRTLTVQTALGEALDRRELRLYYQPMVETRRGRIIGAEALLRWQTPELGMVDTADFLPVAEKTGLILPIGDWVFEQAVRTLAKLLPQSAPGFRLSVHLSCRQLLQTGWVERLASMLREHRIASHHLMLEIAEDALLRRIDDTLRPLQALRQLGVAVAIDNFGIGYSALTLLQQNCITHLKIDRSLISGLPHNEAAARMVRAIIAVADSMDMEVVAEGVENPLQFDALRQWGCGLAQGYLFSIALDDSDLQWLIGRYDALPVSAAAEHRR